ncbi:MULTISPECIES: hypothetical protein [Clostridium]|uniref:Uncharacterized protein n=1 Tax=Clostridium cibarium TaxID=2762247 RepID=A0ABR8PVJ6_9CLOT|nr:MULTISPECIES: hypothetical protein [Clostridium]MBD7912207.1 hypothetical protein [Clostridium cibarium]
MKCDAKKIENVFQKNKDKLLAVKGCTGVGIALKIKNGKTTNIPSIVVFVKKKLCSLPKEEVIPEKLENVPTDVVEQLFDIQFNVPKTTKDEVKNITVNSDPLFSGLQIQSLLGKLDGIVKLGIGTLGCFIYTSGKAASDGNDKIEAGDYMLTCNHTFLSKMIEGEKPAYNECYEPDYNNLCGYYTYGFLNLRLGYDCAIVKVNRKYKNEVQTPNPAGPGYIKSKLNGVYKVTVNDLGKEVYKYGAKTGYTVGRIKTLNVTVPLPSGKTDLGILIEGSAGHKIIDEGDSGSVVVLKENNNVIGLLSVNDNGYINRCYCFDIINQMKCFVDSGGEVRLSHTV